MGDGGFRRVVYGLLLGNIDDVSAHAGGADETAIAEVF